MNVSSDAGITIPGVYNRNTNINIVKNNFRIIDSHKNWNVLLHKEGLKIKEPKPILNNDLKVSKELDLF